MQDSIPTSFDDFGLSDPVKQALEEMGFEQPTEAQAASFAPIIEGKDLMVQARTGTGKTAAFCIPMADRVLGTDAKPQLLALCPTRELALQVAGEFSSIAKHRGLKVVPVYGGAPISKQIRQLEEGVHAVVGTPGRVLDHIRRGTFVLDDIKVLVLDEADEMLSMGFEKEISAIIERLPEKRQTLLFSATIPNGIQRLAGRYMMDPVVLSLSDDFVGAKEIEHSFYMISGMGRTADLLRVIDVEDPDSGLIFCNTREEVNLVYNTLKRQGFRTEMISSDLSQSEREASMARMRDSDVRFLVATDVAARGIDISHVTHVINYSFPESLEVYIHRTGRTGRMGRTGWAVSLITPRDIGNLYFLKLQYRITPIEREIPTEGEETARRESDLLNKLLADHRSEIDVAQLSLARRVLQHQRSAEIVASLLSEVLGPLSDEKIEAAAAARRGRPGTAAPRPKDASEGPRRTRSRANRPAKARATEEGAPIASAPAGDDQKPSNGPAPADGAPPADEAGGDEIVFKEVYLSAGRRDGVRASEIGRLLEAKGIHRDNVDRIRVRDRSTFIGVESDLVETAIEALNGATFGDRVATAELAKRSRS